MANLLEDALRAATAKARAKPTISVASASDARRISAGAAPRPRMTTATPRKRQRSGSLADDGEDPAKRLEAFRQRMFEINHDTPKASVKSVDDVPVVQWKGKKTKKRQGRVMSGGDCEDDNAVPMLSLVKATSKPVAPVRVVADPPNATLPLATKREGKSNKKTHVKKTDAASTKANHDTVRPTIAVPTLRTMPKKKSFPAPKTAKSADEPKPKPVVVKTATGDKTEVDANVHTPPSKPLAEQSVEVMTAPSTVHVESLDETTKPAEGTLPTKDDVLKPVARPRRSRASKKKAKAKCKRMSSLSVDMAADNGSNEHVVSTKESEDDVASVKQSDDADKVESITIDAASSDAELTPQLKSPLLAPAPAPTECTVDTSKQELPTTASTPTTNTVVDAVATKSPLLPTQPSSPTRVAQHQASKPRTSTPFVKPLPVLASKSPERSTVGREEESVFDINALMESTMKAIKAHGKNKRTVVSDSEAEEEEADEATDAAAPPTPSSLKEYQMELFSNLIDEAARDRWELVEVGRLVRIFAAQWGHKKKKTARFLRRYCPELVSIDFMEGLNMDFSAKQLVKIFDRGSGTPVVLMNKVATAIENGHLSVRDTDVVEFIASKTITMATNNEVLAFLMPLLESLSKVQDVGHLLKHVCAHWHVARTAALVQDVLLTPVFDDLDGAQDEILIDLPELRGRLDFPSRLDDEDADENGNLKGLVVGEESDLGEESDDGEDDAEEALGEILSDDAEGEDSHAEDGVYEGETDSEEEAMARMSPTKRKRSRFILDEAEEGDEDDEEGMEGDDEDGFIVNDSEEDDSSEDSNSEEEDDKEHSPRQRKRLRQ